jgi:hypothetical protein
VQACTVTLQIHNHWHIIHCNNSGECEARDSDIPSVAFVWAFVYLFIYLFCSLVIFLVRRALLLLYPFWAPTRPNRSAPPSLALLMVLVPVVAHSYYFPS